MGIFNRVPPSCGIAEIHATALNSVLACIGRRCFASSSYHPREAELGRAARRGELRDARRFLRDGPSAWPACKSLAANSLYGGLWLETADHLVLCLTCFRLGFSARWMYCKTAPRTDLTALCRHSCAVSLPFMLATK